MVAIAATLLKTKTMSQVHIHLLITHLPVFGSVLGALVLIYALFARSIPTKNAAYLLFVISGIGAVVAYLTGEGAEEAVEKMPGVTEQAIEMHEDAAMASLIALIILGAFAIVALFLNMRKTSFSRQVAIGILLVSFAGFGLVARTASLGGKIRHTEIAADGGAAAQPGEQGGGEAEDD